MRINESQSPNKRGHSKIHFKLNDYCNNVRKGYHLINGIARVTRNNSQWGFLDHNKIQVL